MSVKRREKTKLTSKRHGEKFQAEFDAECNLRPIPEEPGWYQWE